MAQLNTGNAFSKDLIWLHYSGLGTHSTSILRNETKIPPTQYKLHVNIKCSTKPINPNRKEEVKKGTCVGVAHGHSITVVISTVLNRVRIGFRDESRKISGRLCLRSVTDIIY